MADDNHGNPSNTFVNENLDTDNETKDTKDKDPLSQNHTNNNSNNLTSTTNATATATSEFNGAHEGGVGGKNSNQTSQTSVAPIPNDQSNKKPLQDVNANSNGPLQSASGASAAETACKTETTPNSSFTVATEKNQNELQQEQEQDQLNQLKDLDLEGQNELRQLKEMQQRSDERKEKRKEFDRRLAEINGEVEQWNSDFDLNNKKSAKRENKTQRKFEKDNIVRRQHELTKDRNAFEKKSLTARAKLLLDTGQISYADIDIKELVDIIMNDLDDVSEEQQPVVLEELFNALTNFMIAAKTPFDSTSNTMRQAIDAIAAIKRKCMRDPDIALSQAHLDKIHDSCDKNGYCVLQAHSTAADIPGSQDDLVSHLLDIFGSLGIKDRFNGGANWTVVDSPDDAASTDGIFLKFRPYVVL